MTRSEPTEVIRPNRVIVRTYENDYQTRKTWVFRIIEGELVLSQYSSALRGERTGDGWVWFTRTWNDPDLILLKGQLPRPSKIPPDVLKKALEYYLNSIRRDGIAVKVGLGGEKLCKINEEGISPP